jgi:hypothetical protein
MTVLKQEIIDLSLRYITSEEMVDFPENGDLFCLLIRALPSDRVLKDDEGWEFNGYGFCKGYTYDEETKPRGKWIWKHYLSLATFPPLLQVLKLQPPHIARGMFQSPDRSHEIRIVKVDTGSETAVNLQNVFNQHKTDETNTESQPENSSEDHNKKIVAFRKRSNS